MKNIFHSIMAERHQPKAPQRSSVRYPENNLSSPEQFQQRLLIEKRRAERLNSETSLIVFDLGKHFIGGNGHAARRERFPDDLVKRVCIMVRETDVVSLYQENLILILLPDTHTTVAHCVYERLKRQLSEIQLDYSQAEDFDLDSIETEILSYSEKFMDERLSKGPVGMRARERWEESSILRASHLNDCKRHSFHSPKLSRGALNSAAIALPVIDVLWWDPQIVSDFLRSAEKALKRLLDIVGAMAGLVLLSPILLLTAILVKTTSRGPILFKQERVGYRGKYFTFLKFRTMHNNCENRIHQEYVKRLIHGKNGEINNGSGEVPLYKIKNDPRITPVGSFLRKTSLDELPQLWNVLVGEMSLVGPRPPIPYEVEEYQKWHYRRFLEVKPGITGLWQVSGRNKTTFEEMVRLDLHYSRHWSLALDIKLLLKTIKVVLLPDGV